jgi:sialic acid synthase SpsE
MTDFIAEVCSNHNNDLTRALALIDTAADLGCTAVKFQLFRLDKLYTPEALNHSNYYQMLQDRRAWELPLEWLPSLANHCRQRGIRFGCTHFYLDAVDELLPYVDFYKVASYNLLDIGLLTKVAQTGKPIMLSTGMATVSEIADAVKILDSCQSVALLHCVSTYPTPLSECQPLAIKYLYRYMVGHPQWRVGWSDHTVKPGAIYHFTLASNVRVVEFHLDLDGKGNEYGLGHCWLPGGIGPVIEAVKDAISVMADPPTGDFSEAEEKERLWRADPGDGLRPLREMRKRL